MGTIPVTVIRQSDGLVIEKFENKTESFQTEFPDQKSLTAAFMQAFYWCQACRAGQSATKKKFVVLLAECRSF